MNKYQVSLKYLENIPLDEDGGVLVDYRTMITLDDECEEFEFNVEETFSALRELVDKETPKKPIEDDSINKKFPMIKFQYVCPNCNKTLSLNYDELPTDYDNRCGCCGQVIDWKYIGEFEDE